MRVILLALGVTEMLLSVGWQLPSLPEGRNRAISKCRILVM